MTILYISAAGLVGFVSNSQYRTVTLTNKLIRWLSGDFGIYSLKWDESSNFLLNSILA